MTRACAVVKSREKGRKRRKETRSRKPLRPSATIINGFFTTVTGKLFVSLGHDRYEMIQLNRYSHGRLAGMKMRSLTLTPDSVSICYSKEVDPVEVNSV
jgi:hypothetical protein